MFILKSVEPTLQILHTQDKHEVIKVLMYGYGLTFNLSTIIVGVFEMCPTLILRDNIPVKMSQIYGADCNMAASTVRGNSGVELLLNFGNEKANYCIIDYIDVFKDGIQFAYHQLKYTQIESEVLTFMRPYTINSILKSI